MKEIQFTQDETRRYGRHFVLPNVGVEGQKKLKAAKVLIIGAGGLGSPAAMYLAATGVGKLGLVDYDNVDITNLHRQLLYSSSDVGKPKVAIAQRRIREINPNIDVEVYQEQLTSRNALAIIDRYDVIIDGSDNLPTRYLVNDACVMLGKPNVYGAVFQFEGQASVFDAKRGPCYRCIFPDPPPPELVPTCAEAGVLGMLPAIIGNIQAVETVKLIVGFGDSLVGRLILFDASAMDFRELKIKKLGSCPVCGDSPTIRTLIDYEEFCGVKPVNVNQPTNQSYKITVKELKQRLDQGEKVTLVDVREQFEYDLVHLEAKLIPLRTLPGKLHELNAGDEIVVYCHTGARSHSAVEFLKTSGFTNVKNLTGGIEAWAREIDPTMMRY
jgi:molybdopterin/thiamine biosynthesis adenylyltransferase/rhodanese-related sulfurtransferase